MASNENVFVSFENVSTLAGSKILRTPKRIKVIITNTIRVVDAGDMNTYCNWCFAIRIFQVVKNIKK